MGRFLLIPMTHYGKFAYMWEIYVNLAMHRNLLSTKVPP